MVSEGICDRALLIFMVPPRVSMMFGSMKLLLAMTKNGFERSVILKLAFLVLRTVISSANESFQFFPGMKTYVCSSCCKIATF